jgi:hypothetical protein
MVLMWFFLRQMTYLAANVTLNGHLIKLVESIVINCDHLKRHKMVFHVSCWWQFGCKAGFTGPGGLYVMHNASTSLHWGTKILGFV